MRPAAGRHGDRHGDSRIGARLDVTITLARVSTSLIAAAGERAAMDNLEITRRQLDHGQVTEIERLTADEAVLQARQGLIQAETARFTDTAALFEALGGGWWAEARR